MTMQRPFVFLATNDPEFECFAIDAIIDSHHGVRLARDPDEARTKLQECGSSLALAIIDTTQPFGVDLLRALGGLKADFPVLAIAGANQPSVELNGLAVFWLQKSISLASLRREICDRCVTGAASA